jgi:hypothetical protein
MGSMYLMNLLTMLALKSKEVSVVGDLAIVKVQGLCLLALRSINYNTD